MTSASAASPPADLSPAADVAIRSTAEVAGRAASGELYALVVLVIILIALVAVVLGVVLLRRAPPTPPPSDPPGGPCDGCSASREMAEIRDELRDLGRRMDAGLRAVHGRVDTMQATLLASFARGHHPHAAE